jgi:hypothetical protein
VVLKAEAVFQTSLAILRCAFLRRADSDGIKL